MVKEIEDRFKEVAKGPESSMSADWYYIQGDRRQGPVTVDALRQLIGPGDLVWRPGMASWEPASRVAELQTEGPATRPLEPSPLPVRVIPVAPSPVRVVRPATKNARWIWVLGGIGGFVVLALVCSGIMRWWHSRNLAQADALYGEGKHKEAVSLYKRHFSAVEKDKQPEVLRRIIETELAAGDKEEAKYWLTTHFDLAKRATFTSAEAKALVAEREAEIDPKLAKAQLVEAEARKRMAEADQLWDSGQRREAADIYSRLAGLSSDDGKGWAPSPTPPPKLTRDEVRRIAKRVREFKLAQADAEWQAGKRSAAARAYRLLKETKGTFSPDEQKLIDSRITQAEPDEVREAFTAAERSWNSGMKARAYEQYSALRKNPRHLALLSEEDRRVIESRVKEYSQQITSVFLPHKPDTAAHYCVVLLDGKETPTFMYRHLHAKNGIVVRTLDSVGRFDFDKKRPTVRMGTLEGGDYEPANDLNKRIKGHYHRLRGGFIEVGDAGQVLSGFERAGEADRDFAAVWKPVLKIGARLNDAWEASLPSPPGTTAVVKYKVLRFGSHRVKSEKADRMTVTVQEDMLVNGAAVTVTESTYLERIGLLDRLVYVVKGKEKVAASRWLLQDATAGTIPTVERMFFSRD